MQVSDCRLSRRLLLLSTAGLAATLAPTGATARTIEGMPPWAPNVGTPPPAVAPGPWMFFTPKEEGTLMESGADRLIPPGTPVCGRRGHDNGAPSATRSMLTRLDGSA